jgi:glycosyltransferase involved in cell wall biosynthesis
MRMIKNISLALMVRNEAEWLTKTLPVVAPWFYSKVALDTGSTDASVDVLKAYGFDVFNVGWKGDFSQARNSLLMVAQSSGTPWTLMLDADECMYPEDIDQLDDLCARTRKDLITLPRWNFTVTPDYVNVKTYPDRQARLLRCDAPLEFRNPVHEVVCYKGSERNAVGEQKDEFLKHFHIYHYGACKPHDNIWLRSENYQRIARGESELRDAPEWVKRMSHQEWVNQLNANPDIELKPFKQPHPLENPHGA